MIKIEETKRLDLVVYIEYPGGLTDWCLPLRSLIERISWATFKKANHSRDLPKLFCIF